MKEKWFDPNKNMESLGKRTDILGIFHVKFLW
jgi:hypothetical protein